MNEMATERTTSVIALEIRTLTKQAQHIILGYAIEIGRRLKEAKAMIPHGQWGEWLRTEVSYSQSTAQNFMRIFDEYGSDQLGLFGPEAKSQALGNLSYTKALSLLALPAEERETFIAEHDVESMSTRELQQALKERDEAKRRAEELEAMAGMARADADDQQARNKELQQKLQEAQEAYAVAIEEQLRIEKQLKELEARPIDVAVQELDPKIIDEAVKKAADEAEKRAKAEAEAELRDKIEKAKAAKEKAEQRLKELQDDVDKRIKDLEDQKQKEIDAARSEAEALRAKLKTADPDTAAFKVHFDAFQAEWAHMKLIVEKLPTDRSEKLRAAMKALVNALATQVTEL